MIKKGEVLVEKLNPEQRLLVFRLHAEGYSSDEIARQVKEHFGIDFSGTQVYRTCRAQKNQVHIEKFREDYLARVKAVPIANKRVRIDDLERIRTKLLKMISECPTDRKASRQELLMMMKRLNETICVAREEMENKPQMMQAISIGQFSNYSDEELQKRKEELIAKATGSYKRRDIGIGDSAEGADSEDLPEPS